MNYIIFDDLFLRFDEVAPLKTQLDIRVGVLKLRQKLEGLLGIEEDYIIISEDIQSVYEERFPDKNINVIPKGENLLVNGRIRLDAKVLDLLEQVPEDSLLLNNEGEFIAAKFTQQEDKKVTSESFNEIDFENLNAVKADINLWSSLDEIVANNAKNIQSDYQDFFYDEDNSLETEPGVTVINPYDVWIGDRAKLQHGVVVDATNGCVIIDEGVVIGTNSYIEGPVYIGKNTTIKPLTSIMPGTSIGSNCNIGGEIKESILQSFVTKPYNGTLNRCYIGEWTKFEAGINIDSDFFEDDLVISVRDYSLVFMVSNSSDDYICQYQEMRKIKLEAYKKKFDLKLSDTESRLLKKNLEDKI